MLPLAFMPHGHCYMWSPWLLFTQVLSDSLTGASYVAIAVTLVRIVRQRRDGSLNGVGLCFALFLVMCGATHLLEVWNIWHADYWFAAGFKSAAAAASIASAFYVLRLQSAMLVLPTPRQLAMLNARLKSRSTELTQTEHRLEASEEQFRTAFDFAGIGMAVVGLDGRWLRVNRRVCEITGYTEAELLATTCQAITHPEDVKREGDALQSLRSGEQRFFQMEKRYRHKTGAEVAIRVTKALVRDRQGAALHFVGQIEDISDRKRLEEQLQQARKMEAVGQLAGGIAHDYNNILTSTMMQIGLLLAEPDQKPSTARAYAEILKDANRAAALTRQLLTFSRRQLMQMKPMDLSLAAENIFGMLQRLIGENIQLRLTRGSPVCIEADVGMIDQIVTNLVINARDAIGSRSGTITVSVGTRQLAATNVDGVARPGGEYAFIAVVDTGCGMDAETKQHVFEPFFTTKAAGKGTGLGLASAYGIAQQHRGWIEVQSEKDQGSTFTVYLPVAKGLGSATDDVAAAAPCGGTETILLVEDQVEVRNVARASLERLGYRVIEATDGVHALEVWATCKGRVDLLFSDMVMPGDLSGWQLAQKLQQECPTLRVLLSSGYSVDLKNAGVPSGVAFIQKPYELTTLTECVQRTLRSATAAAS